MGALGKHLRVGKGRDWYYVSNLSRLASPRTLPLRRVSKAVTWAYSNINMIKEHKDAQHICDGCDYGEKVSDSPKAVIGLILEILEKERAICT